MRHQEATRSLPNDGRGAVVTIGTFDGVHIGHREVLKEIVSRARRTGRRSVVVTFHPHPLRIVRPEIAPPLLTTPAEKKLILAQTGLEYAVFLKFDRELQQYSARRFVEEILIRGLGMQELVIGYDHGFGKDREGSVDTMRELGEEHDFSVDVVDAVQVGDQAVSSTKIRQALAAGDVVRAARGLGRPYSLQGPVVHGDGRGRELGYPTANVQLADPEKMLPLEGIYAIVATTAGKRIRGLLHLGPRPALGDPRPTIEAHLLDWSADLYGQELQIEFCSRIRGVEHFPTIEAMVERIREDERAAREIFAGRAGPSACDEVATVLELPA